MDGHDFFIAGKFFGLLNPIVRLALFKSKTCPLKTKLQLGTIEVNIPSI